MIKKNKILIFLTLVLLILVYFPLLTSLSIGGDTVYHYKSMFKNFSYIPYAWALFNNNGFGGFTFPFVSNQILTILITFFTFFLSNWGSIIKFVYIVPFLVIGFISSWLLAREIFKNAFFYILIPIYLLNTYILMIISGGQLLVAITIALVPLSLFLLIKTFFSSKYYYFLSFLIIYNLVIMLDLRFAYTTGFIILLFLLAQFLKKNKLEITKKKLIFFASTICISLLINSFWFFPTILSKVSPSEFGIAYASQDAVGYLSFAKFENAISLLHPNWPENIFGKTYFMKPEFLLLPILAFASLFFVNKLKEKEIKFNILFFAFIGVLGAFLAKGSNPPFGEIYLWLFNHFPGFIMFRDASKWYLLVAISYSILIPFSISKIYEWLKSLSTFKTYDLRFMTKNKIINIQNMFLLLLISYLFFLIRPALLGQLGGTFKTTTVPGEYVKLEQFLSSRDNFSRILWIPTTQRFGFYSNTHPSVSAEVFFNNFNLNEVTDKLKVNEDLVGKASIKFVIIPFDSQGEIFLTDRKYDNLLYEKIINEVSKISWLKRVNCCGKIAVFQNINYKDHFWSFDENLKINNKFINPTQYKVSVKNAAKGDSLIFSESFDSKWEAKNSEFIVFSSQYDKRFNSFKLPKSGDYSFELYYKPQDWVNIGSAVSVISLVGVLILLVIFYKKR